MGEWLTDMYYPKKEEKWKILYETMPSCVPCGISEREQGYETIKRLEKKTFLWAITCILPIILCDTIYRICTIECTVIVGSKGPCVKKELGMYSIYTL